MPREIEIHGEDRIGMFEELKGMDWGVLVVESQGGTAAYLVGQSQESAAKLLRDVADTLDRPLD